MVFKSQIYVCMKLKAQTRHESYELANTNPNKALISAYNHSQDPIL